MSVLRRSQVLTCFLICLAGYVEPGFDSSVWQDPDPDIPESLTIYMCESWSPGTVIMDILTVGDIGVIIPEDTDAYEIFEVVNNQLRIRDDISADKYDFETQFQTLGTVLSIASQNAIVVTVVNEDVNDNTPIFDPASYETTISELMLTGGGYVMDVTATDKDITPIFSGITYTIKEEPNGNYAFFDINSATGQVTLRNSAVMLQPNVYELTVIATDTDPDSPLSSSATLTVNVQAAPEFVDLDTDVVTSVNENIGSDVTIYTVDANGVDLDLTIKSQSEPVFVLDGFDVKLAPGATLDKESLTDQYDLFFTLSDGLVSVDSAKLTINVNELNDNRPTFTEDDPSITIPETIAIGSQVYDAAATDDDVGASDLFFSLSGVGSEMFAIDEETGIVTVAGGLDFTLKNQYILTLTVTDDLVDPLTGTTTLTINLETGPKFESPIADETITIQEQNTGSDVVIADLSAVDEDGDTLLTFTLESQLPSTLPPLFKISNDAKLVMTREVDVETLGIDPEYTLELRVSDGTPDTNDETIYVKVLVVDSNDELPVFQSDEITTKVHELSPTGTSVATMAAIDSDISDNYRTLRYSLTSVSGAHTDFDIDALTGEITVGNQLSYTNRPMYELLVVAKDISDSPRSSTATVNIEIVTGYGFVYPVDGTELIITEKDTEDESFVIANLLAKDPDNDGVLSYSIVSQQPSTTPQLFDIANLNDLVITRPVDTDLPGVISDYTLQLRVTDGNSYSYDEVITVDISIEDSDEKPVFEKEIEKIEILEWLEPGSYVYTVTAKDPDVTPAYADIFYSLPGNTAGLPQFTIDHNTGVIQLGDNLDYNEIEIHDIEVRASGNDPTLYSTMHLLVQVRTKPNFDNLMEGTVIEVDENSPAGELIYMLEVSDKDQADLGTAITTTIQSQGPGEMFVLENGSALKKNTGVVLDAEDEQIYTITFSATDGTYETTSEVLTVKVRDINDNPPVIADIGDVTIDENMGLNSEVVLISATDQDVTAPNNELTYIIYDGNYDNLFSINAQTGSITLSNQPVFNDKKDYVLTVQVTDGGSPQNTAYKSFRVNINDEAVNECADSPCRNGATCNSYLNTYTCSCAPGFNGNNCESNIVDCTPNSCYNGGECIDGINSFFCECLEGWSGNSCSEACNNNRYGRNCAFTCDCPSSKLSSDVGAQQCDINTGACRCNNFWSGTQCENDVNECEENRNPCTSNTKCLNEEGGYKCICKTGFTEINGVCRQDPPRSYIPKVGEIALPFALELDRPGPCMDLEDPAVYAVEEEKIIAAIQRKLGQVTVIVIFIECDPFRFETQIITNNTEAAKVWLANDIQAIRDESSLLYDGEIVPVQNVVVNNRQLAPTSQSSQSMAEKTCAVYTAYTTCRTDEDCVYENGMASCEAVKEDNLPLILGLALGLTLPLLFLAALACCCFWMLKRRNRRKDRRFKREIVEAYPPRYYDEKGLSSLPVEETVTVPYEHYGY